MIREEMINIATDAFRAADWIIGTISGGIEAPRIIKKITATDNEVTIEYTYPAVCGLSDCIYHDTRAGSIYTDTFVIADGSLTLNDTEDYLNVRGYDDAYTRAAITRFHEKYPMIANRYNTCTE